MRAEMNPLAHLVIEHPFASIWLALTFVAWIVIYASTRRRADPAQDRRPRFDLV